MRAASGPAFFISLSLIQQNYFVLASFALKIASGKKCIISDRTKFAKLGLFSFV